MTIIKINGITQNLNDFDGTESISFFYRNKNESGESGNSYSPELNVVGEAFIYLYNELVNQPAPSLTTATFDVYDDCCTDDSGNYLQLFRGLVRGSDVTHCEYPNCEMTITVIDNTNDAIAIACLKNTFPWDRLPRLNGTGTSDGEDTYRIAPLTGYCVDIRPNFLQELIIIFGIIFIYAFFPVLIVVGIIVTAINAIIFIVGGTPIGNGDINFIDDILQFKQTLEELITGCGFKHKTPFIHSYIQNSCEVCGLNLSSSFFAPGGPYHNTMRMDAAFKAGKRLDNRVLDVYEQNKPNVNNVQFLEELKQFNLDWRVTGGQLVIERKDSFSSGLWFDASTLEENQLISICFDPIDELPKAFAEYQYAKDGIDNTGDETNPDWVDRSIDWNSPVNPTQVGLYSVNFRYSTSQFRDDSGRDSKSALDKPIYKGFLPSLTDYEGVMLMERGIAGFPRLLQWDGISDMLDARIQRYTNDISEPLYDYNVDWWVKTGYVDGNGVSRNTLYQRLFFIDDPRTSGIKIRPYTVIVDANCDLISGLGVDVTNKLDKIVRVPIGGVVRDGTIEEIEYNVTDRTIRVSGKI